MTLPPDYDSSFINPLRPPEVEGEKGAWTSRWLLKVGRPVSQRSLASAAVTISNGEVDVRLTDLGRQRVRLEILSPRHPLDVEAYVEIDEVLISLDRELGGILEINDSPREWWRTFRQRRGPDKEVPGP